MNIDNQLYQHYQKFASIAMLLIADEGKTFIIGAGR